MAVRERHRRDPARPPVRPGWSLCLEVALVTLALAGLATSSPESWWVLLLVVPLPPLWSAAWDRLAGGTPLRRALGYEVTDDGGRRARFGPLVRRELVRVAFATWFGVMFGAFAMRSARIYDRSQAGLSGTEVRGAPRRGPLLGALVAAVVTLALSIGALVVDTSYDQTVVGVLLAVAAWWAVLAAFSLVPALGELSHLRHAGVDVLPSCHLELYEDEAPLAPSHREPSYVGVRDERHLLDLPPTLRVRRASHELELELIEDDGDGWREDT